MQRQQAFEAYERAGLPHRRIEDWKYTDLRALMREVLPLAAAPDAAALARADAAPEAACDRRAYAGWCWWMAFRAELSDIAGLDAGVGVRSLREVLEEAGNAGAQLTCSAPACFRCRWLR